MYFLTGYFVMVPEFAAQRTSAYGPLITGVYS